MALASAYGGHENMRATQLWADSQTLKERANEIVGNDREKASAHYSAALVAEEATKILSKLRQIDPILSNSYRELFVSAFVTSVSEYTRAGESARFFDLDIAEAYGKRAQRVMERYILSSAIADSSSFESELSRLFKQIERQRSGGPAQIVDYEERRTLGQTLRNAARKVTGKE